MGVAVVTGANRGIGLGLAKKLAERGHDVVGTVRPGNNSDELSAVAKVVTLDVTDPVTVADFAASVDDIEVLINNAGTMSRDAAESGPLAQLDAEALDRVFRVNTIGPVLVTQALAPKLSSGAKVINISSGLGSLAETSGQVNFGYSVSKAALNMVTRQMAFDPALQNCIVVSICPGWVQTRMGGQEALITAEESTAGIVSVIERLVASDTGSFLRYNGERPPW